MTVSGTHDTALVALSIALATFASYTALDLSSRSRAASGWSCHAWLGAAAVTMGGGIWAMHFVAMLAFSMTNVPVHYHLDLTLLSLALPILVAGVGFHVVGHRGAGWSTTAVSGLFMGLGIVAMHYTGMAAMHMPADLSYDNLWVAISVLIAIGAATAALLVAFRNTGIRERAAASVVMGLAISGMHFAAMKAAIFTARPMAAEAHGHANLDQTNLALAVAGVTFLILFLAIVAAMFDRRFAMLANREAEALRSSEERFRTLYKKTPLPLHSINPDGIIEHVSDAWLDLLGYEREEVIGRHVAQFLTPDSVHRHQDLWPKFLAEGVVKDVEYQAVTKSGQVLDVLASGRVEHDGDGRVRGTLGGLVDITARRQAEEALRQAQKIEAVGQLTGGVAHDFNNLLAIVLGNLELMRKRLPDDPKLLRMLDNAMQGAQRGAALTQRLLSFARRQDLRAGPADVPDLVKGMADLLQRSVGPMVRVETRFPLGLPCALVDANQLELALLNLAVNARDAMPEGGTIIIAAREKTVGPSHASSLPPGEYVCLTVTDTGHGMDEATLARATEPFFTTKGLGKGTGLGLSMVHGLAAQSGGRLVIKSRPGEGTTAEIWLPAAEPKPSTGSAIHIDTAGAAALAESLTILVVDDDPLVLQNTAAALEDLGHRAVEAASGSEALDRLAAAEAFDLVITDQAMPEMTGLRLAEKIKAHRPELPVIIATGYADWPPDVDPDIRRLNKPFGQEALAQAIAEAMQASASGTVVPFRARHG